jgi:hypothetical protein
LFWEDQKGATREGSAEILPHGDEMGIARLGQPLGCRFRS